MTPEEEAYRSGRSGTASDLIETILADGLFDDHGYGLGWIPTKVLIQKSGASGGTISYNLKSLKGDGIVEDKRTPGGTRERAWRIISLPVREAFPEQPVKPEPYNPTFLAALAEILE